MMHARQSLYRHTYSHLFKGHRFISEENVVNILQIVVLTPHKTKQVK